MFLCVPICSDASFAADFKKACADLKATLAFDAISGESATQLFELMPLGSEICVYGGLSQKPAGPFETGALISTAKKVTGFYLGNTTLPSAAYGLLLPGGGSFLSVLDVLLLVRCLAAQTVAVEAAECAAYCVQTRQERAPHRSGGHLSHVTSPQLLRAAYLNARRCSLCNCWILVACCLCRTQVAPALMSYVKNMSGGKVCIGPQLTQPILKAQSDAKKNE